MIYFRFRYKIKKNRKHVGDDRLPDFQLKVIDDRNRFDENCEKLIHLYHVHVKN